jgi:hypothetical protein
MTGQECPGYACRMRCHSRTDLCPSIPPLLTGRRNWVLLAESGHKLDAPVHAGHARNDLGWDDKRMEFDVSRGHDDNARIWHRLVNARRNMSWVSDRLQRRRRFRSYRSEPELWRRLTWRGLLERCWCWRRLIRRRTLHHTRRNRQEKCCQKGSFHTKLDARH